MSRCREDELAEKIQELRCRMRAMPRGSNLGEFLDRECTEFARLLREDLAAGHEQAASEEADFPPSGVPELPEREDFEPGAKEAQSRDG